MGTFTWKYTRSISQKLLIEYYTYNDLRIIIRDEWKVEDEKYEKQCIKLYKEYEEEKREKQIKNSKSARIRKLEQMRLTDSLVNKIKLRQELKNKYETIFINIIMFSFTSVVDRLYRNFVVRTPYWYPSNFIYGYINGC